MVTAQPEPVAASFDLIVIGGGAAGCFAAGVAAEQGARVLLLEKNRACGAKLLITGKGRCNLTNTESDPRRFCEAFGRQGKALLTALFAFPVEQTMAFFEERGLSLQQERGGRVFPAQGGAPDVHKILMKYLKDTQVTILSDCEVQEIFLDNDRITGLQTSKGVLRAQRYIMATGGLSYPETGSTGDGYGWARKSGHKIIEPKPALVPLRLDADWTKELLDLNLKNVNLSARLGNKLIAERFGEVFFTRSGIGGPIVLDMSAAVRDALAKGPVTLLLDLKPAVNEEMFDRRLQRELAEHSNRDFSNALNNLLPKRLIPLFVRLSEISPEKKCHSVTREERSKLLHLFKQWRLTVTGIDTPERAIITSGGVSLGDIDMRTMGSKKIANLYFVGEMIDLDGPTGGYNLQLCWSTGYLAGVSAGFPDGTNYHF